MPVQEIQNLEEFRQAIDGDKPTIVDFWAPWCGPCRIISPIFEKLSDQFPNVAFYKVNTEACDTVSQEVGIRALPTFMLFKSGSKIGDTVGANPSNIETLIKKAAD